MEEFDTNAMDFIFDEDGEQLMMDLDALEELSVDEEVLDAPVSHKLEDAIELNEEEE